jgi:hypothetical protein
MTLSTRLASSLWMTVSLLSLSSVFAQKIQFCGDAECRIPLAESCSGLKSNHEFFGSCCHLEDIVGTGGCRVTVWNGNCAWARKCGECNQEAEGCNIEYRTASTQQCETDRFRVLGGARPTSAPVMAEMDNSTSTSTNGTATSTTRQAANDTTPSPTAPVFPTMAPTCPAETTPPVAGGAPAPTAPSGAATMMVMMMNVVVIAGGVAAMTLFGIM